MEYVRQFAVEHSDSYDAVTWTKRTVEILDKDGVPVFRQEGIEAPEFWSDRAVRVVAQKYFRGKVGTPARETSVKQLIDRVVNTICDWGVEQGYFTVPNGDAFIQDLKYLLINQMGAFNSPVWFNLGVKDVAQQVSACFINGVEDNLESIAQLQYNETLVFKRGSGSGTNFSKLRSRKETLSAGGTPSGPVSFMKGLDAWGGVIKSGGTCLAPYQRVYTHRGPVRVAELAKEDHFFALSYDPPRGRYAVKRARAWCAGEKDVVKVTTDKGTFHTSWDHPYRLSTGEYRLAKDLTGASLFRCSVDLVQDKYLRVHLRNGKKGKEKLHRLVVQDIRQEALHGGQVVHHIDGNTFNNAPTNLQVLSQAKHAALHGADLAQKGEHVFQTETFTHEGPANGMHRTSAFWQDAERVARYKNAQSENMSSERARRQQSQSARQRMLNIAFRVLNAGGSVDSFQEYYQGRTKYVGRTAGPTYVRRSIERCFGSFESFQQAVQDGNHRVLAVEPVGRMQVFDVEVDCPTADDKTPETGHNFVIWPTDAHTGSGVVVANTRRAAKMCILNVDHPDIVEFVRCKTEEEERAHALIREGYNSHFDDEKGAYASVAFQNANHSVRVTDAFMRAVKDALEAGEAGKKTMWPLVGVTTGEVIESIPVLDLWKEICESAWRCGDPGIQFDGMTQKMHTCPHYAPIRGSNPCQPENAPVLTPDGIRSYGQVGVGDTIWSGQRWTKIVRKVATGVKPVYRYHTRAGVFTGTEEHRVVSYGEKTEVKDAEAIDVAKGPEPEATLTLDTQDILDGLMLGGGTVVYANGGANIYPLLCVGDNDHDYFNDPVHKHINPTPYDDKRHRVEGTTLTAAELPYTHLRKVPSRFVHADTRRVCGFLRGLYSANGSVVKTRVTLKASSFAVIEAVQLMLSSLGIQSYYTTHKPKMVQFENGEYERKQSYDLNITGDRHLFRTHIGFIQQDKQARLDHACSRPVNAKRIKHTYDIVDKEYVGDLPVYDITVDADEHTYWTGGLLVSNCGEYIFVDDTSCNLASLNLLKFRENGSFNYDKFTKAVRIFITAMDILVAKADYPTEALTRETKKFRTLGLGYTNLGALLMVSGLAYDSAEARHLASEITSTMTAEAYFMSTRLAKLLGPFEEIAPIQMLDVLREHKAAAAKRGLASVHMWTRVCEEAAEYGVRNAQTTVIAPTGTISFMMDCDTTGCEPELSLRKVKYLVGGGVETMDNRLVDEALTSLGYSKHTSLRLLDVIKKEGCLRGDLGDFDRDQHLAVFDCALTDGNGRTLSPDAHLYMTAAIQPFISGAISKTINLPKEATVEDISDAYLLAYALGLKSTTVYRDGCKESQPMAATTQTKEKHEEKHEEKHVCARKPHRHKLNPHQTNMHRVRLKFGTTKGYILVTPFEDTGMPGEVFVKLAKEGSTISGLVDGWAQAISFCLQYGVPFETLVDKFAYTKFEPSGMSSDPDIRFATSVYDAIMRKLQAVFLPDAVVQPRQDSDDDDDVAPLPLANESRDDVGVCSSCGGLLVRSGTCHTCTNCGTTTGCG